LESVEGSLREDDTVPLEMTLSEPTEVDILAYRGDSGRFRISVSDNDEPPNPIDISGMTWDADIREHRNDATAIGSFAVEPVVGQTNSVDVILPKDVAALLPKKSYYDVEMSDGTNVTTLVYGLIKALEDVSRV
jgi:hypothetical protein